MHLCLASDNGYFIGLAVAVTSICARTVDYDLCFHILDGGLPEKDKSSLEKKILAFNKENEITFYSFDQGSLNGYRVGAGHSYMAYARLFMPKILDLPKVIYLDCDVLILKSLNGLWETSIGDRGIAASSDEIIKNLSEDYPFEKEFVDTPYFNSGVMLVNLDYWRKEKVLEKTISLINEGPEKFKFWDQTALNVLFSGDIKPIDKKWNKMAKLVNLPSDSIAILHFLTGKKPWNVQPECIHDLFWQESARILIGYKGMKMNILSEDGLRSWKDNKVISCTILYFLQIQFLHLKKALGGSPDVIKGRLGVYTQRRSEFKKMKKAQIHLRDFAQRIFLR